MPRGQLNLFEPNIHANLVLYRVTFQRCVLKSRECINDLLCLSAFTCGMRPNMLYVHSRCFAQNHIPLSPVVNTHTCSLRAPSSSSLAWHMAAFFSSKRSFHSANCPGSRSGRDCVARAVSHHDYKHFLRTALNIIAMRLSHVNFSCHLKERNRICQDILEQ